jgi:DNA polymerase I
MKTLLLIDSHAIIHRAFHALPPLTTRDGILTNAVHGFFAMIYKMTIDFQPSHVIACFDTPTPSFRKELFIEYQAKRPPMIDGLKPQFGIIKELLDQAGIARLEKPGFEADDVIGTLVERHKNEVDRILILTGDKDILQLVDDKVFVITPLVGVSTIKLYTTEEVTTKFGIEPKQIPDYKALAGDASDNYNTAKGIGPKTAVGLLTRFHTIENLFDHIDEVEKEKIRTILQQYKETIILFKQIATIVRNVEVDMKLEQAEFHGYNEHMKEGLMKYHLHSLLQRFFNVPKTSKVEQKTEPPEKKEDNDQMGLF